MVLNNKQWPLRRHVSPIRLPSLKNGSCTEQEFRSVVVLEPRGIDDETQSARLTLRTLVWLVRLCSLRRSQALSWLKDMTLPSPISTQEDHDGPEPGLSRREPCQPTRTRPYSSGSRISIGNRIYPDTALADSKHTISPHGIIRHHYLPASNNETSGFESSQFLDIASSVANGTYPSHTDPSEYPVRHAYERRSRTDAHSGAPSLSICGSRWGPLLIPESPAFHETSI